MTELPIAEQWPQDIISVQLDPVCPLLFPHFRASSISSNFWPSAHESPVQGRASALQGSTVSGVEEREDAQEGASGYLLWQDQRVERSEGTTPLTISVCAIAVSDCKSWQFH